MSVYGVSYIEEGKYKNNIKGTTKMTKAYTTWKSMLGRCYYLEKVWQKHKKRITEREVLKKRTGCRTNINKTCGTQGNQ